MTELPIARLPLFGSEEAPLRPSRLPSLMRCPMSAVVEMCMEGDSGSAADTGTAVHFAVRAWHMSRDAQLSIGAMRMAVDKFPLADLDSAEHQFWCYSQDPRNGSAEVVLLERQITVRLPPTEDDPTQKEVVIVGTLDQVRRTKGRLILWDVKTGGAHEGPDMLNEHCLQLAAYQQGATDLLGEPVRGAGIIRTKDYLKCDRKRAPKPGPVFYEAPWVWADVPTLLYGVRHEVARIRRAQLTVSPSSGACKYCIGVGNCTRLKREIEREVSALRSEPAG